MLDRRSLLVAGASSLASIMLPRVPGSANAFILPFAPTEAYADEKDPFRVLVLSRTMFGVVVVDVANKNTPIAGAQVTLTSRHAAGKQLTADRVGNVGVSAPTADRQTQAVPVLESGIAT